MPLTTRLFPRNLGAQNYRITGVADRCDWVVLSDRKHPKNHMHRRVDTDHPRFIFLSLRDPFHAIRYFCEQILPKLTKPFVLVSGSGDATVPRQIDQRWRRFDNQERTLIDRLAHHPLLIRWFAENLDATPYPVMVPLPVGLVFPDRLPHPITPPRLEAIGTRPNQVLCGHRIRPGPQWYTRRRITRLAETHWATFCTPLETEVSEDKFWRIARQHNFILCAEGGGLDPSPKAWEGILQGAIPIIRTSPLKSAYQELPVAFVDAWQPDAITPEKLQRWAEDARAIWGRGTEHVMDRLSLNYWWQRIEDSYGNRLL